MSPEVLIYIRSVKEYLKKNIEAREYFLSNVDEELFYKYLTEISQKNYEKNGEVMLSKEQFEILKKTISAITISKKEFIEDKKDKLFFYVDGFDKFSLN